jgi:HlyD family secretion protein
MFRIARDNLLELDAEVPEAVILGIREGSSAQVTLADGEILQGIVRLIAPTIDPETKLGRVRIRLPANESLRVGGFGSAAFRQAQEPITVVPEKAVQFEASGPQVTLIDAQNRAKRAPVKTGARMDGLVELVQGPPVGSRIALGGGAFLLDGDLVVPVAVQTAGSAPAPQPAGN